MTLPETLDHILETIVTVADRSRMVVVLDKIAHDAFNVKTDIEKNISDNVPESFSEALFAYFKEANIDGKNAQQVSSAIIDLKDQLARLPILTLRIAVEPTRTMLMDIQTWAKKNTGANILIKTLIDPTIIAGCVIEWKGNYKNMSFTKSFESKKGAIISRILA